MKPYRLIVCTWLARVVVVIGLQALATARLLPVYPDPRSPHLTPQGVIIPASTAPGRS